jgi:hypothetical protein
MTIIIQSYSLFICLHNSANASLKKARAKMESEKPTYEQRQTEADWTVIKIH